MTAAFNHVGQCVTDLERSKRFYCELFGFVAEREITPPDDGSAQLMSLTAPVGMTASYLVRDGLVLELLHYGAEGGTQPFRPRTMNEPGLTHLSLSVDDVPATCARVRGVRGRGDRELRHRRGYLRPRPRRPAARAVAVDLPDRTRRTGLPLMSESPDVVSVERVIPAPPEKIFEYLVHPEQHRTIDGSGSVRAAKDADERLQLGSKFGMKMKIGVPYSMVSTVIEFEEGRRIAWQTYPPGLGGKLAGGRIWRYELEPVEGGTRVRETWDVSQERLKPLVKVGGSAERTRKNMEATLENIEHLVAG